MTRTVRSSDGMTADTIAQALLISASSDTARVTTSEILGWLSERQAVHSCSVSKVPLSELGEWTVDLETGNIAHSSGRFFSVEGLEFQIDSPAGPLTGGQPIINQTEVGIVGFLGQQIDGVMHFLVQAKMEPGNVNCVQLSPTVQATYSNYTQVHGGRRPLYLDYFLDRNRSHVVFDQLQSEQGSRFLRKRNRNIVVMAPPTDRVEPNPDFVWVTLRQLTELLTLDNTVNMDARSVMASLRLCSGAGHQVSAGGSDSDFKTAVCESAADTDGADLELDLVGAMSWFTEMQTRYRLSSSLVPLRSLQGWDFDGRTVHHEHGELFSVVGVDIASSGREVVAWQQPLIESVPGGLIAFVCQRRKGILHFLVQALVEPGNFDAVELAPTVQRTSGDAPGSSGHHLPPFAELVLGAPAEQVRYDALLSEEGGRFYHDQNRYMIVELDESQVVDPPSNFAWMTLGQLQEFVRFKNQVNIEARSLLAYLVGLIGESR